MNFPASGIFSKNRYRKGRRRSSSVGVEGMENTLKNRGVDVLDDLADGAALARGAPALDEHQHRQALFFQLHLLLGKLFLGGL